MTAYRCYALDRDGRITSSEVIECPTDAAAVTEAERKLATGKYLALEVWHKERHIGTVGRSAENQETTAQNPRASTDSFGTQS